MMCTACGWDGPSPCWCFGRTAGLRLGEKRKLLKQSIARAKRQILRDEAKLAALAPKAKP